MRGIVVTVIILSGLVVLSCGGGKDNGVKPDTTPPSAVSTNPADAATNVRAGANITVTFSEEMNDSTIDSTTLGMSGGVKGVISYANRTATFDPITDLAGNTVYFVVVDSVVKDVAGNSLGAKYIWDFKTAASEMANADEYFPMADGDTWYYKNLAAETIVRVVSGDTTINNRVCKRILENGVTTEAWSIDTSGFYTHLLDKILWFDPPLRIPLNLVQDSLYNFSSTVYWTIGDTLFESSLEGSLAFKGYVPKTVPAGQFDSVFRFSYLPEGYYECYARGVGLLDNGDYVLDSAVIGGVKYP